MKKVNLKNCLVNAEESTEALKNVNGGCYLKVALCSRDGVFFTERIAHREGGFYCSNRAKHESIAKRDFAAFLKTYGINGGTTYWEASARALVGDNASFSNFELYYVPRSGSKIKLTPV